MNIFTKVLSLLLLFLIPVVLLYTFTYNSSINVIQQQIVENQNGKLKFMVNQVSSQLQQLMDINILLSRDADAKEFAELNSDQYSTYDWVNIVRRLQNKLSYQSTLSSWKNDVRIFSSGNQLALASETPIPYEQLSINDRPTGRWVYDSKRESFFLYMKSANRTIIVETELYLDNILDMLSAFDTTGDGETLLYRPSDEKLLGNFPNSDYTETTMELRNLLRSVQLQDTGQMVREMHATRYSFHYSKSGISDFYVVNYVPLEDILAPVKQSSSLFYAGLTLLFGMSASLAYVLYRNIQIPLKRLIGGLSSMRRGDLSTRIQGESSREFTFLFHRFNEMAIQIQHLIETVYLEKIRLNEVTLKQLQSQINPHFLYNCLSYMINMSKLNDNKAVIAMGRHLSSYYRYTTRTEKQILPLHQELGHVSNYMEIQSMRFPYLRYECHVPQTMLEQNVPLLLIQPIVENCLQHGFPFPTEDACIVITGEEKGRDYLLRIEDNGVGLNEEQLQSLMELLQLPLSETTGCGLWNVHHRAVHHFGTDAGLSVQPSPLGGLSVLLHWRDQSMTTKEQSHDTIVNR
ncbi:sensor histidine kinase [Paenibacillus swuensis]|nr:histidine kinase [Paenibacillus swuensis]